MLWVAAAIGGILLFGVLGRLFQLIQDDFGGAILLVLKVGFIAALILGIGVGLRYLYALDGTALPWGAATNQAAAPPTG